VWRKGSVIKILGCESWYYRLESGWNSLYFLFYFYFWLICWHVYSLHKRYIHVLFSKYVVIVATIFSLDRTWKMLLPGDLNPCHQLRSQTPIPLSLICCYIARLIKTYYSLTKGTPLLYNNVNLWNVRRLSYYSWKKVSAKPNKSDSIIWFIWPCTDLSS